jgi:SAM-dependent methyltransferase
VSTNSGGGVRAVNQRFYDSLWSGARLIGPDRFNTWPLVRHLAASAPRRLEIGAGLRPRLPIKDTHFADISEPALAELEAAGGQVAASGIEDLPYADGSFDLVCALDIIEHVEDDIAALTEIARVADTGATVLLSTPLHPEYWTTFDEIVGHYRRYEPSRLMGLLDDVGLSVERSAVFGMKPRLSPLVRIGMWFLQRRPERSLWWYNNVFMPMGLRFQKPLKMSDGMVDVEGVDEVFLVCRRR